VQRLPNHSFGQNRSHGHECEGSAESEKAGSRLHIEMLV
jgi:hypothetical protein